MPRDQNAGRTHNIKTDKYSFERVEQSKCLGTALTHCRPNFLLNVSTPVYKMWIIQEPKRVTL
jgi:hypothetical protein